MTPDVAGDLVVAVNGENRSLTPGITVAGLLAEMRISATRVAVEYNREILPKELYARTILSNGDRLEVVQFVGGG